MKARAQYLQTTKDIGYVVLGIDAEYSTLVLEKITTVEGRFAVEYNFKATVGGEQP